MTRLDCNVINCAYNQDNCCKRRDITVEGESATRSSDTCCGNYTRRGSGNASNSFGYPTKDTRVACDAKDCMFNHKKECQAAHIGISGGHASMRRGTECASFHMQ